MTFADASASREHVEGFRRAQRLSYACAIAVARELKEGITEKQAAARMGEFLGDHGVRAYFHKPLAWFGDQTRFHKSRMYRYFFPRERALRPGDVIILDVAPIVEGYVGDIGFAFSLEPQPRLQKARAFLQELRHEIPAMFESAMTTSEIWAEIDRRFRERGYSNCHAKYPFSVLGHRVYKVEKPLSNALFPFTITTYASFASHGVFKELLGPGHKGSKDGLWAIEPHLGSDELAGVGSSPEGFGAKFEEILWVENGRARWIDDAVPHLDLPQGVY